MYPHQGCIRTKLVTYLMLETRTFGMIYPLNLLFLVYLEIIIQKVINTWL